MSADKTRHKPSTKHTLGEVLKTLQDLVRNELADPAHTVQERGPGRGAAARGPSAGAPPERGVVERNASRDTTTQAPVPSENVAPAAPSVAESGPDPEPPILTEVIIAGPGIAPDDVAGTSDTPAWRTPEQTSINWDDIPVLQDVIELPGTTQGLTPERARAIASQAVAKVNAELRKAGQPPLDPDIIERLENALRTLLGPATDAHQH